MGDFERTFGAGADASDIIEGLTRPSAEEYRAAEVRFSESGKSYLVNCSDEHRAQPGEFVIVRLRGHFTSLHKAQVIRAGVTQGEACKHTVVCRAEEAKNYGEGPDGVRTPEDLDRFLTEGIVLIVAWN